MEEAWVFYREKTAIYVVVGCALDEDARRRVAESVGATSCEAVSAWDVADSEEELLAKIARGG